MLDELKNRYSCAVGLSDHSGTIFPSLAAVALGARLIEVHAVFSKQCFGPDTKSSLDMAELSQLVSGIRFIEKGLKIEVDKDAAAQKRSDTKQLFARSAFYSSDQKPGDIFGAGSYAMKKPGGGLLGADVERFIGRTLKVSRSRDDFVNREDFL